jgi:phosphopantothenoylcysteine decarboxylase/phosphopantothenate--cysteine ligase
MRCLVTCGPTYEKLDEVRRLTNFSTGKLGIGLANHLVHAGHQVTLLKGYYAICTDHCEVAHSTFTTTEDLLTCIREASRTPYDAVFHAAAVSDFRFGTVFRRGLNDRLEPITSAKFKTHDGNILAELIPTPKILNRLRTLFPSSKIFGWKYEVDGTREQAIELGRKQIRDNQTNYCVINGPAYKDGYGVIRPGSQPVHCPSAEDLYRILLQLTLA